MMINFFELKYLIVDCFYTEYLKNNYSLDQSIGICYESFTEYTNSNGIEMVISIAEIISLKIRHNGKINENDKEYMISVLELYDNLEIKDYLNEEEYEYLDEKMEIIKYYYTK